MSLPTSDELPAHYQIISARNQPAPNPRVTDASPPNSEESVRHFTLDEWEAGRRYPTRSDIHVRSKIEKVIADFYLPIYDLDNEHFGVTEAEYQWAGLVAF